MTDPRVRAPRAKPSTALSRKTASASRPLVFIAHKSSHLDVHVAELLAEQLRERDIAYFLDKDTLQLGDDFEERLLSAVGSATLVVVLFPQTPSSWVAFEAACAFFEQKLMPVSLAGSPVPEPYDRIQIHRVEVQGDSPNLKSVEAIADQVERKLFGTETDRRWIALSDGLNRLFDKGLQVILGALFVVGLLLIAYDADLESINRGHVILHLNHLHVILGATILGGQFFVSLCFAHALASPIHPKRDAAFRSAERVFFFWLCLTPFQPMLGIALAVAKYGGMPAAPPWLWLAFVLYLVSLLLTCSGYGLARARRQDPITPENRRTLGHLNLLANLLFLLGFIVTVSVINLMLWKPWA